MILIRRLTKHGPNEGGLFGWQAFSMMIAGVQGMCHSLSHVAQWFPALRCIALSMTYDLSFKKNKKEEDPHDFQYYTPLCLY